MKYRKAYFEIEKVLKSDFYSVIMMLGLRKMGKTTILKQLAENHGGHYVNFREVADPQKEYLEIFDRKEKLILLDEIGYFPDFDTFFSALEVDIKNAKKKVVLTSSSYGTLKQLGRESMGGGRSHKVELFPIDFEEYLYFSDKISGYGVDYDPRAEDVEDYFRMKNVPSGMELVIDKEYMLETFSDNEVAHANHLHAIRDVILTQQQYSAVIDIIAYTLNDHISTKRFTGAQIGAREFGKNVGGLSLSESLIGLANKIVNGMVTPALRNFGAKDLAHIISYLYHSGFLFVDLQMDESNHQISDLVMHDLRAVSDFEDFKNLLMRYTFSVISPLLYTRLLVDLEDIVGTLYMNKSLTGGIYELAIKAESVYRKGYNIYHDSYKFKSGEAEVDLCSSGLLLEAAVGHKNERDHNVNKVLADKYFVRVVTDEPGVFKDMGNYYRIGYPNALLMLSNGTIFDLKPSKVDVSTEMNKF